MALAPADIPAEVAADGVAEEPKDLPPYSESDLLENGIGCYKCSKFTTKKSWLAMVEHLRRQHGVKWGDLKGSHLHTMARKESRDNEKTRYGEKKNKTTEGCIPQSTGATSAEVPAPGRHLAGQKRTRDDDDGVWKAMWVKVGSDGMPTWPLQVRDMIGANDVGKPSVASGSGNQQIANPLPANATAKPALALDTPPTMPAAAPANSAQPAVPGDDWASQLPKVTLKADYSTVTVPEPSTSGARALWPVNLKGFQVDIPAFVSHLANDKNQGHSAQEDTGLEIHTAGPRRRQPL